MADKVKKIPASESGPGVLCQTASGQWYRITQNPDKKRHTLWAVMPDGFQKIGASSNPHDLYKRIDFSK